jgi:hypothetical protein
MNSSQPASAWQANPSSQPAAGWEPFVPADVRDEQHIRDARQARLDQQLHVRVRCTDAKLHTIQLSLGRLRLLDHHAAERRQLPPATAPWQERERAMALLPRCLQVLQAWRDAGRRPGHAWKVKATKARPEHWTVNDPVLPPRLRKARSQTITDGVARRYLRTWLGWPALRADNAAAKVAELAVRCEYGRYARPRLLLTPPASGFGVNACPYDTGRVLGDVHPRPDPDAPPGVEASEPGGISVGLRHNWLASLWWRGLGAVDGRLVLDVWRQPEEVVYRRPIAGADQVAAGRLLAAVIDWAGYVPYAEATSRPGLVGAAAVALQRDQAGRWHLADPDVGTTIRLVRGSGDAAG